MSTSRRDPFDTDHFPVLLDARARRRTNEELRFRVPQTNSEVLEEEIQLDPEHEFILVPVLLRLLDAPHKSGDEFLSTSIHLDTLSDTEV